MTRSATGRFLASFCLTMLAGAAASANPTGDRLFVLVSPPHVAGPSAIVAFDHGSDGIPVQAESCSTGGTGRGQNSPQGVVTDSRGRFLFAANNESNTIAAFAIRPDGRLETVAASPFAVGEPPLTYPPVFLTTTPEASFLYAAAQGALVAFEIPDDGALGVIQSLPGTMAEIATSPAGDYLYAAGLFTAAVHAYRITSSGLLEELDDSPYAYDASRPYQVVVSADGLRVWVLDLDTGIAAFDVADDGSLDLSGQTATGTFAQALTSATDDTFLYAATPFQPAVLGFAADATAPVALPSSPFPAEYTAIELLASPDSSRLYQVNAQYASILPMAIETNGDLSVVAHFVDVDQASVRFGPAGAIPAHRLPHRLVDIDGDGESDVVLHFRTEATGIECGDTTAGLTGLTFDGREFAGSDAIDVLGCGAIGRRFDFD